MSAYGELPTPTRDGYTFLGWGYGVPINYQVVEYLEFTGTQYIETSIIPSNHITEVGFDFEEYNQEALFGTSQSYPYYSFTGYSGRYYWGRNGSDASGGVWSTGKHTLIYNGDNNAVIVDGTIIGSGNLITSSTNLRIGTEANRCYLNGKVYYFKITDKSTGNIICNMIPCYRKSDNIIGMYDTVNSSFYTNAGSGTFGKGSDVKHITSSTQVITNENHTLYAVWQKN